MAYSADTFVADEQPTTAKWNKLWSNDASFNDGTGIADNVILARHMANDSVSMQTDVVFDGCILRKSADQTITNSVITAVTWDTETADTNSYHSTSVNTSRITVPATGKYLMTYGVAFAANATAQRYGWLGKNGNTSDRFNGYIQGNASGSDKSAYLGMSVEVLTAADYWEVYVFQNSGSNLALTGGTSVGASQFTMVRLGS